MENLKNIKKIFEKYIENECAPGEVDLLMAFLKNHKTAAGQMFDEQLSASSPAGGIRDPEVKEKLRLRLQKILKEISVKEETPVVSVNRDTRFLRWRNIAAAAMVILLAGAGTWYLFDRNQPPETVSAPVSPANDIAAPSATRAAITLANGQQIFLDSAGKGLLGTEGEVNITKTSDGQIAYSGSNKEIAMNTLTNPRGSRTVSLTLSDGTKVWLNAGSSVTYPAAFTGSERKVSLTGEAYFEVAHNTSVPFRVEKGKTVVTVLGTHFNVNAYDDEDAIKVTLLEGSVEVRDPSASIKIIPGEQAVVSNNNNLPIRKQTVDPDKVMAWKDGLFEFDNADLAAIMRQVSRWYDVDVVYDGKLSDARFGGGISKNLPLSGVLKLMEANGVKFTLEGKVLRVVP